MKTVKVYDATGFITCVGDNYDTIKEEFKNKSKKYGLRFNEDIYSDTMLKCYEAIQKDDGKEIDVIAYFWTSFKYNMINEGKKWINHTVDEIPELSEFDEGLTSLEDRELLDCLTSYLYRHFRNEVVDMYFEHANGAAYKDLTDEKNFDKLDYTFRKIRKKIDDFKKKFFK